MGGSNICLSVIAKLALELHGKLYWDDNVGLILKFVAITWSSKSPCTVKHWHAPWSANALQIFMKVSILACHFPPASLVSKICELARTIEANSVRKIARRRVDAIAKCYAIVERVQEIILGGLTVKEIIMKHSRDDWTFGSHQISVYMWNLYRGHLILGGHVK
jgi:hypothetical protein